MQSCVQLGIKIMSRSGRVSCTRSTTKRGRGIGTLLTRALSKIPVGSIVNTAIDALPVELHIPGGYQYCGPGTKLQKRLNRGDPGINKLDQACKEHDIAYSKHSDSTNRSIADKVLAEKAWQRVKSSDASVGERASALAVAAAMRAKTTVSGGGRRRRRTRGRRIKQRRGGNIKRRGGRKKKQKSSKSLVHGQIRSWSLPQTIPTCLLNRRKQLKIPKKALTNIELTKYAKCLKIPFFRGVFMKDRLPRKIFENETGIVNLDNSNGPGTHWVCYKKLRNTVYYFDSFGNLPPPKELQIYFSNVNNVLYNFERRQLPNTDVCGHLCLEFLATSVTT